LIVFESIYKCFIKVSDICIYTQILFLLSIKIRILNTFQNKYMHPVLEYF